jgi:hypothetical protein
MLMPKRERRFDARPCRPTKQRRKSSGGEVVAEWWTVG